MVCSLLHVGAYFLTLRHDIQKLSQSIQLKISDGHKKIADLMVVTNEESVKNYDIMCDLIRG